ncbi:MAG TPA: CPBP family intramembrane glutamic endopeptidase [Actinomycetota bacterium]
MTAEHVPPRPDSLHRVPDTPSPPPRPDGSARPVATWSWWEALAVYLLAMLLGSVVAVPVLGLIEDQDLEDMLATIVVAVVTVGALLLWLNAAHPSWRGAVGFPGRGRWWAEVRSGIGFGLLLYPGMVFGVGLVLSLLLRAVSGEVVQTPEQVPPDLSAVGLAATALYAFVIAPIHEELFFRGILFRGVRDRYGLAAGLMASGVGFSLIHYLDGPWQGTVLLMGVMFFNGIALAWFYERRGNLVANLVAHSMFNVIGLALILTIG